jgi:outer membrane receptor protein involved in Fe transport
MKRDTRLPCVARRFVLFSALAIGPATPLWPQAAPAPAVEPQSLAKYDANKNGVLDADELIVMRADEAKAAKTPVAANEAAAAQKEEAIQLSPFEVSAGNDRGYAAANTLAGTRLNSPIEDIAGSISVVTKQQLADTAALDINDIFLYEVGTEGTGQFTDLTNDGRGDYDNVAGNPTGANRMRGLSSANIAVGGFNSSSSIPIDTYNIDAIEIARGPNSNLAGLSDAGGTVNLITSRGNVSRASSRVQTRVDSYGGFRASLDVNRPLIQDKLGLRFSAVYNEIGYVRKPSVDRTTRQQLALTYKPFRTTSINASYEFFNEFGNRANSITPRDTITPWKAGGSPTWDPVSLTYTLNGVRSAPITNINQLPAAIGGIGSSNARILQYIDDGKIQFLMRGANVANAALGTSTLQQFVTSSNISLAGPLYKIPGTTNKSIYDWTDINMAASGYEIQHAKIANVSVDQSVFNTPRNRLDLNLAWRREDQTDYRRMFIGQQDGVGTTLVVDVNEKLLDGRPNPYFLHPFIGGVNPQVYTKPVFNDNYRWQAAYQLDLRHEPNLLKWLGLHRLNGYQEYQLNIQSPNGLRYHDMVVDNPDFLGTGVTNPTPTTNLTGSAGALMYPIYYFGKTPGGGVEYAAAAPVPANGMFNASYLSTTQTARNLNDPVNLQERYFAIGQQKKKTRGSGATVQSYFFNDQIITTFGKRHDRVYTEDNLPTTLVNGFYDETNLWNFGTGKRWRSGDTDTKGVVVKPFRGFSYLSRMSSEATGIPRLLAQAVHGFSFYYNTSNSFKPADTAYNLYLQALPNPSGETKEFGFGLNMFDNRFWVRLTHQKTMQVHTRAGTGTIATRVLGLDFHPGGQNLSFNLYDAATNWEQQIHPNYTPEQAQAAGAKDIGYTYDYIQTASGLTIADVSDAQSQGWELEMQFNPTRNWTLKATGNQQEAIDSNISLFIQKYIDERMPTWTTIKIPTTPLPDGTLLPSAGELWWTLRQGSQGIPRDYFTGNVQTPLNLAITTQGKKKPQTREYSFNAITSYRLAGIAGDRKWLKNVTVGGAYRWASKGAIGYYAGPPDSDGVVRTLDKTKPIYDKAVGNVDLNMSYRTRLFRDRVGTTFQLNVRNATESGHLQGVAVNPDGQFWQYRIIDPRQFILTVTFDL